MGKAKKLRSTSHKKKTSSATGASLADMEAYAHLPREQAEMFQGLSNDQGSIREATCVALATMFGDLHSDDEERKSREKLTRMVENGLLRKLVPLIADPLKMVRLHALGALRNISVTGGIDTCEFMTVDASVVTPLVRLVAETATLERLEKNDLHGVQVLEQTMALLTNLCESSAAAIHELTRGNLLDPIMLIARHGRAHNALHLETLKLLLLITDGNATLSDVFGSNAAYQTVLGELIEADAASVPMLTRLHVVGIAMHIQAIMQNDANVAKLLPIIDAALAYDAVHVVQAAQQAAEGWALAHQTPYDDQDDADPITDEAKAMQTQAQLKVRLWKDNVQTLMLALELVAELAAPSGDDDDADEDEWASDDEEAMEQYAASQMDTAARSGASASSGMGAALAASQALPLCVTILQGVVSVPSIDNATIAHDFERIRIRVANALTNLVGSLPWELLHNDALPQLFRNFCTLYRNVVTESATKKLDIDVISSTNDVEAATTAAMWAVLRRCSSENQQLPIAGDDATLIMTSALQSKSVATRLNTIGMVGCVGQQTKDAAENAVVGRCLLSSLNDGNLEVVAEALNALFDVYGDEDFDGTFKELGLLPALEAVVPMFKSKLRAEQKALDRDVVAHLKETQLNLMRFIKYKKKHL